MARHSTQSVFKAVAYGKACLVFHVGAASQHGSWEYVLDVRGPGSGVDFRFEG